MNILLALLDEFASQGWWCAPSAQDNHRFSKRLFPASVVNYQLAAETSSLASNHLMAWQGSEQATTGNYSPLQQLQCTELAMACCAPTLQSSVLSTGSATLSTGNTSTTMHDRHHVQQFANACRLCPLCGSPWAAVHAAPLPAKPAVNPAAAPFRGNPVPMCLVTQPLSTPLTTSPSKILASTPYCEKRQLSPRTITASRLT